MGYSAMCHEAIPISLPAPRQDQWARHVITVEPEFWEQFRLMTMSARPRSAGLRKALIRRLAEHSASSKEILRYPASDRFVDP